MPHGAVLGRVTTDGGLVLDSAVMCFHVRLDSRRVTVKCPCCHRTREFRGIAVFSAKAQQDTDRGTH